MLIDRIWLDQPGRYGCISTKSASGKWVDHFFPRRKFKRVNAFIKRNADKDLYFCPHLFSEPVRTKEYAVLPKLLWSDLDEADPRDIRLKPTYAIQSSPGRFVGIWRTKEVVSEAINRRLAYFLGADISGWDLTQVLRVPGTINYKYASHPRTKILWSDGDEYSLKHIEKVLPDEDELDSAEETDASEVYKKYVKKMSPWLRHELNLKKEPPQGKRSEMLWKIGNELTEIGMDPDEVFVTLKASLWNKFAGRYNEDKQLRREVDKILNRKHQAKRQVAGEDEDEDERENLSITPLQLSEVEEEETNWVWYPYLARGEITILEGDPEAGKSYISQYVSGKICSGDKLPFSDDRPLKGNVIYFDLENDPARVTKKRMVWNGFDNEVLKNFFQVVDLFSIDDDEKIQEVQDLFERLRPVLVVFDTLNTYIGMANTSQGAQAQQSFMRFVELARRFDCSVLILRHLTKGSRDKAMYRGQGNIAFTGVSRIQITAGRHPEDPEVRVMACSKLSLAAKPQAITYEIVSKGTKEERDRSIIEWGDSIDLTADDLVAPAQAKGNKDRTEAKDFLETTLERGGVEWTKLLRMAEARSISERTLRRAADEMGIQRESEGFGKKKTTIWSLPD